jgi:ankyrin repeat protein
MVAAMQGNAEAALLLLERGADPMRRSPSGERPSALARREGHVVLAEMLERETKK